MHFVQYGYSPQCSILSACLYNVLIHFLCILYCISFVYSEAICIMLKIWDCVQLLQYRYKRTAVESQTLAAVKIELEKIDTILSNDVLILRDKIEEVNRKFESSRFAVHSSPSMTSGMQSFAYCLHCISMYIYICIGSGSNMLKASMLLPSWNSIEQLKQKSS